MEKESKISHGVAENAFITALELFGLMRVLDYFQVQDYVSDFGMIGLSYGGFYTLFMAAVDTRVKAAVSCAFFSNRKDYAWSDWTWFDAENKFSDAEIACLVYPRKLCIEVGSKDDLFDIRSAREEIKRLKEMGSHQKADWLEVIEFDGGHEFCLEDSPIEKLVKEITDDL